MTTPDPATKFASLLMQLGNVAESPDPWQDGQPEGVDPLLWHLIFSFMAWEAGFSCAAAAACRIHAAVVDYNELRVCLPDELVCILGTDYPLARERSLRLRTTLNGIYRREHDVSLSSLADLGRREARLYLESLEGMPLFVSARLSLLSLDAHAFPLDERIRTALVDEQALPPDLDVVEATGWLERYFRAGEAAPAYNLLERWLSQRPVRGGPGGEKAGKRSTRS